MRTDCQNIEDLQLELEENIELLNEAIEENDIHGIKTQKRVIAIIERQIEEASLPNELVGEVYGFDFY